MIACYHPSCQLAAAASVFPAALVLDSRERMPACIAPADPLHLIANRKSLIHLSCSPLFFSLSLPYLCHPDDALRGTRGRRTKQERLLRPTKRFSQAARQRATPSSASLSHGALVLPIKRHQDAGRPSALVMRRRRSAAA